MEKLWSAYLLNLYRGVYSLFRLGDSYGRRGKSNTDALFPRFYCPVIQLDVPVLDNNGGLGIGAATRDMIRTRFTEWVSETTDERDGPGAGAMRDANKPQYEVCLIVDDYCLQKFAEARTDDERHEAPIIVLERDWTLGWMYARVEFLGSLYARLTEGPEHSAFYDVYTRPPRAFPDGANGFWKVGW
ncbi:hypothetical protein BO71DRAFT_404416 [Aspergillus ellipticus CBS 707.79]|uniref:Uncharacterized protein n=1 Tax=Aspergillus ellipticus CBS 707.79 TaxID=1448320 RepID=A0A319DI12_9EURO|nr:hypothetical protein BO71DRAFT_404416 [Aspergillus ellipticus CBS 707.79]